MSITLHSARHDLTDLDYEARVIGGLLRDCDSACAATKRLEPEHFAHPHFTAIFSAIRAIEAKGRSPSMPAVREHLIAHGMPAAEPWIEIALDNCIPSADEPRLHLFAERILDLAELRCLRALVGSVDLILGDEALDWSSRIEAAHKAMREDLRKLVGELGRAVA